MLTSAYYQAGPPPDAADEDNVSDGRVRPAGSTCSGTGEILARSRRRLSRGKPPHAVNTAGRKREQTW